VISALVSSLYSHYAISIALFSQSQPVRSFRMVFPSQKCDFSRCLLSVVSINFVVFTNDAGFEFGSLTGRTLCIFPVSCLGFLSVS
jgi:hypothetical protein